MFQIIKPLETKLLGCLNSKEEPCISKWERAKPKSLPRVEAAVASLVS